MLVAELTPLAAVAIRRPPAGHPRIWIAAWATTVWLTDALMLGLALARIRNHWVFYVLAPVQAAALFWALGLWQPGQIVRLAMRAAIPVFIVAWAVVVIFIEDTGSFSVVAAPLYSVLGLVATTATLVIRSAAAREPLLAQDWLWACAGVAIYFVLMAPFGPFGILLKDRPDLVFRALELRGILITLAFLAIAKGLLCPLPTLSGVSSSPAPSALPSS